MHSQTLHLIVEQDGSNKRLAMYFFHGRGHGLKTQWSNPMRMPALASLLPEHPLQTLEFRRLQPCWRCCAGMNQGA